MRNLKKLLAVIITVAMLATLMVPAFAEENSLSAAEICERLGMLKGTTGQVTDEYLATELTRHQMAIMFLRLRGLEAEANAFDGADNFDDANEIKYAEGRAVMAYLKAHPELGLVGSEGKFMPLKNVEAQEYFKVMLVALGYEQGKDFEWADVLSFAAEHGLPSAANFENNQYLTAGDVAEITVEALKAEDAEGNLLIEKLIALGAIDEDVAIEVGLIEEKPEEVSAISVEATGSKRLTVSFDAPVDPAQTTITVAKGAIAVNTEKIEYAENKMSADITTVTNLTAGEYTVTVKIGEKELKASVQVENVKVAQIRLLSDKAPMLGNIGTEDGKKAVVNYEVLNQYGEAMSGVTINWTPSTGQGLEETRNGQLILESTNYFTPGQIVYLTGVHVETGTVLNTQVEIVLPSNVDSVEFKGIYDTEKSEMASLPAGFEDDRYVLLFEVKDQYGNKTKAANLSDIVFISDNPLVATVSFDSVAEVEVGGVKYQAASIVRGDRVGSGGTVTIKATSIYSGKTASYTLEVPAVAVLANFSMSAPAGIVAEGETVEIPFTAVDQFGNAITKYNDLQSAVDSKLLTLTASEGTIKFTKKDDGTAKLEYTAPTSVVKNNVDYPVYISSVVLGGNVSNISFNIKAKAVASVVVGLDKVITNFVEGASATITGENIKVQDQHGRTILWKDYSGDENLYLTSSNDSVMDVAIDDDGNFVLTAVNKGTATLTLKINDNADSAYSFTVRVVKASEVETYEIADIPLMKAGTAKDLVVTGKLANGAAVVLDPTTVVKKIVSTNESVVEATYGVTIKALGTIDDSKDDVTTSVVVTIEGPSGPVYITKNVTVSYKSPRAETIEVDDVIYVEDFEDSTLLAKFKVVDQYGDEIEVGKGVIVKTNEVVENGKTVSCTVTLVTPNGKIAKTTAKLLDEN